MSEVLQTVLFVLPTAIIAYTSWRQLRQYQTLLNKHNHFCMAATCILRMHGKELSDGKRALFVPADLLHELSSARLNIVMCTDDEGAIELVGLVADFTEEDEPPRRKRPVEPIVLDADMQAALA